MPHKTRLYRLFDDITIREELLTFVTSVSSENVAEDQRDAFIPVLARILYGKYTAKQSGNKQGKESSAGRRNAILSFMSNFELGEIKFFVQHVLQVCLYLCLCLSRSLRCKGLYLYTVSGLFRVEWCIRLDSSGVFLS